MASSSMSIVRLHRIADLAPSSSSQASQFLPALKLPVWKRSDGLACSSLVGIGIATLRCKQRFNVAGLCSKGKKNGGSRQITRGISSVSALIAAEPYPLGSAEEFGFTMVHHTAPHIPFKNSSEWNSAVAQLGGTVHCDYPSYIVIDGSAVSDVKAFLWVEIPLERNYVPLDEGVEESKVLGSLRKLMPEAM